MTPLHYKKWNRFGDGQCFLQERIEDCNANELGGGAFVSLYGGDRWKIC